MSLERYKARWESHFGTEPWWEMHLAMYENLDWEGAREALEQQTYALAKARGIDTLQTCSGCGQVRDEATCFDKGWPECAVCVAQAEAERQERIRQQAEAKAKHEAWYASLTPEQQREYDAEQRRQYGFMISGLVKRDVQ